MKRITYRSLVSLLVVLTLCLTILLPIIFSSNNYANAENFLKNVDNVPFLTV